MPANDSTATHSARTTPAAAAVPTLRVRDLAFRYGRDPVWQSVSFDVHPGEAAFLVGDNGSGKSTLLRCLAGWAQPDAGAIELCGTPLDPRSRSQRRLVSFVPDTPSFYDDLTAAEHLRFALAANHLPADDDAIDAHLGTFGLLNAKNRYPSSYSRGMRQKLALALAFLLKPWLLLLDEPHGPLERRAADALGTLCNQARARGAALIISCHHDAPQLKPDLVISLNEEGARIERGRSA